jgi:hypothetical protein
MKKLSTFILGLMIIVPVMLVVAAVWLYRVVGKDIIKFVYGTGETAYNYLKARYERQEQPEEPAESEKTDEQ